jgi:hypothetical protein
MLQISHIFVIPLFPAKGRTNLELREQFILAQGVSQSMATFVPRSPGGSHSGGSSVSSYSTTSYASTRTASSTTSGPITKVSKIVKCHFAHFGETSFN